MSGDVQFEEDNAGLSYRQNFYTQEKPKLFKLVESFGVPEEYVNYVLLGFVILIITVSVVLFSNSERKIDVNKVVPPGTIDPTMPASLK